MISQYVAPAANDAFRTLLNEEYPRIQITPGAAARSKGIVRFGERAPVVILHMGRWFVDMLHWRGKPGPTVPWSNIVMPRRCLVPIALETRDATSEPICLVGGIWFPIGEWEPSSFSLLTVAAENGQNVGEGSALPIPARNWSDWLNPTKDVRGLVAQLSSQRQAA